MAEALATTPARLKRDITIDILRGFFLFVIIVDHLGSFPSIFEPITGGGRLLVSAAEGFFFLSGLLVGRLRGNDVRNGRVRKANMWLIHRATVLYIVSIILTLGFTLIARQLHYSPRVTLGVSHASWVWTTLRALTLQYSFGLSDMLPLYALYLLISIGVLYLLGKGRWRLVLTLSAGIWFLSYFAPGTLRPVGTYFSATSWQLLFFGGMVLGFHNDAVQEWWSGIGAQLRLRILGFLTAAAGIGIALSWAFRLVPGLYDHYK